MPIDRFQHPSHERRLIDRMLRLCGRCLHHNFGNARRLVPTPFIRYGFRAIYASRGLWGSLAPFPRRRNHPELFHQYREMGSFVIATGYFLLVWVIQPIAITLRLDESCLLTAFLAAAVVALLLIRDEIQRSC